WMRGCEHACSQLDRPAHAARLDRLHGVYPGDRAYWNDPAVGEWRGLARGVLHTALSIGRRRSSPGRDAGVALVVRNCLDQLARRSSVYYAWSGKEYAHD